MGKEEGQLACSDKEALQLLLVSRA